MSQHRGDAASAAATAGGGRRPLVSWMRRRSSNDTIMRMMSSSLIPPLYDNDNGNDNDGDSSSSSNSSSKQRSLQITTTTKAGEDGYSLLRRPLSWDSESDPSFDAPKVLDETLQDERNHGRGRGRGHGKEKIWFETKRHQSRRHENENESEDESEDNDVGQIIIKDKRRISTEPNTLNLLERTLKTLDYPLVLKTLKEECNTLPAKRIVEKAIGIDNDGDGDGDGKDDDGKDDAFTNREKKKTVSKQQISSSSSSSSSSIASMGLTANTVSEIHERYRAVKEMKDILNGNAMINVNVNVPQSQGHNQGQGQNQRPKRDKKNAVKIVSSPPLNHPNFDLEPMWEKIDAGGVLDGPDVFEVRSIMEACRDVYHWCMDLERATTSSATATATATTGTSKDDKDAIDSPPPLFYQLPNYGKSIYVDPDLLELLQTAFDEEGRLSGTTFQGIGRLRAKVRSLKGDILMTLDRLLSTPSMKSKISLESGGALYSEVRGRIVIPISEQYANSVGIVHDVSRSGKTAYMEPNEIVKPTNEMNQAIVELKREENKIWRMLTTKITESRSDIDQSVAVIAQLDLVLARIRLGDRISGVIPEVKDEGVISLKNAKHPILLLREIDNVIGSDIDIGAGNNQGLILTGPNSGGKTVILKLLGLSALMARDGIPVPAHPDGARVDFFNPVLADIGDIQSVGDDLSTFSGHMLVCREVLASSCRNALVLMDELGSGTDPNQGVAIAQAILEALLSTGSRVAITTHYLQLKQLAAADDRFSVAAMQFINGKPTYKLLPGIVGESFALSVAERLNLPQSVIDRASELMDSDTKQMGELIRNIEDQKSEIDKEYLEVLRKRKELEALEEDVKAQKRKLEREQINARKTEAAKFAKRLEEKEQILENILQTLKNDPSKKMIVKGWDEIKYVRRDAFIEAENIPSVLSRKEREASDDLQQNVDLVPIAEMRTKPNLEIGQTLIICKDGPLKGKRASIVNFSGKRVDVNAQGVQLSMKMTEVALLPMSHKSVEDDEQNDERKKTMSKMARKALEAEKADVNAGSSTTSTEQSSSTSVMRLSSNTVDCLGCSFEEARRQCENMFSKFMTHKHPVVFILHGHGSKGILKTKIREWLGRERQFVKKFGPADPSDGGDAFTKVELKKSLL